MWFRYPLRPKHWVFRGLNLTIKPKDRIAIVGESGQGKSTFISLLMRFYDADFGEILIDGIEIKKYNIKKLRERMGLVMQEPTLFNYTVKENILYGNPTASNKEIVDACQVANARVFIESEELQKAFDDNIQSLKETMKVSAYKDALIQKWTEPEFEAKLKQLEQINAKEEKLGKFKPVVDQLDVRTQEQKGTESLNSGYEILCGNRGSKLSGG